MLKLIGIFVLGFFLGTCFGYLMAALLSMDDRSHSNNADYDPLDKTELNKEI